MPALLIATKNAHKTEEIRAILGASWTVTDLTAHLEMPAPEETGSTFAENAALKALAAAQLSPGVVLADDSGLEVDALGGAPGVYSARYAGKGATDAANRVKLLQELSAVPAAQRTARFQCVIALAQGHEVLGIFAGAVEGLIVSTQRGSGGFGYDSLFVPAGYEQTFAELPGKVKNSLSHRARAMAGAAEFLGKVAARD